MPDDHSKLEPLLPIPNRTVKRLRADDSADSRVKVGHRQALTAKKAPPVWELFDAQAFSLPLQKSVLTQALLRYEVKRKGVKRRFKTAVKIVLQ